MRREFDRGLSKPKMNTLESEKALIGILGLPDILPELSGRHAAFWTRSDCGPEVLGAQEAKVSTVLHECGADGLRFRCEQSGSNEPVEERCLGSSELDCE